MAKKRIGILTGGGDCPGLNAVIRGVTKCVINAHHGIAAELGADGDAIAETSFRAMIPGCS